jgi:peptidoglycan/LPS O-acetylase OafA/YrhL
MAQSAIRDWQTHREVVFMTIATQSHQALPYRRDIDGLRAIAVGLVILFHVGNFGVAGGFIGVDVFFVISGYLISQRILYGIDRKQFSFKNFYTRRIRRLFPAMLCTVLATLLAGLFILSPSELNRLALTAMSSILSVANIHFYVQSGYWDTDALRKPLLHMWSLGVEEQFYIFWPFLLILIGRVAHFSRWILFGAITVISILVTTYYTRLDSSGAFYLTPFRVYEFAIGGLCVASDKIQWRSNILQTAIRNVMFVAGLVIMLWSGLAFSEKMLFPGYLAAVPCLGAALVIVAGCPPGISILLTNPLSRYIGLISYSLYLVHWPVVVFTRMKFGDATLAVSLACILATLVLAVAQYYLVETPLRRPVGKPPQSFDRDGAFTRSALGAALGFGIVSLIGMGIVSNKGLPSRYDQSLLEIVQLDPEVVNDQRTLARFSLCKQSRQGIFCGKVKNGKINVLVLGDSHADDALNALQAAFPKKNYLISSIGGCPFLVEHKDFKAPNAKCAEKNEVRDKQLRKLVPKIDVLVVAQRFRSESNKEFIATLQSFKGMNVKVIVVGAGPVFSEDVSALIAEHGSLSNLDEALSRKSETDQYIAESAVRDVIDTLGITYLSKKAFFCPTDNVCRILMSDGMPIAVDRHHLTISAARDYGRWIRKTYPNLLSKQ